jgi:hypothetical protein
MNNLELRMYGIVIYQLTPIQAGIQFQHATTRYGRLYDTKTYRDWADNWQTSIVLNGGTTNLNPDRLGTINKLYAEIKNLGIDCEAFYEPDLGDQMTAFTLILDERIFDKKKYPDFGLDYDPIEEKFIRNENWGLTPTQEWIDNIGGSVNVTLRQKITTLPLWK